MQLVVAMGFGAPALLMLLLSVWTINAHNLYSAGLSMAATFPAIRPWIFIVAGGAVGCTFALLGIIDSFVPFLNAPGLVIPPIAALYVIAGFRRFGRAAGPEPPAPRKSSRQGQGVSVS